MPADRMTTKGYLGITLFILLLFCLVHVYQRTSPGGQISALADKRFTFASQKEFPSPGGQEPPPERRFTFAPQKEYVESSPQISEGSSQQSPTFREAAPESTGRKELENNWRNSSYEVGLLKRIAGSDLPDDKFLQHHLRRQQERHARRNAVCSSLYGPSDGSHPDVGKVHNIYVNEKYKFVYCSIPKVACTSWKSVLLVLDDKATSTDQFPQAAINHNSGRWMKQLWRYRPEEQKHILETYTKFMFSRDPFTRVLSAFRNKLAPDTSFVRAWRWQSKLGTKIMKKFRPQGYRRDDPYDLTFSEFSQYVSSSHRFNKHWNLQHKQCLPCDIDYTILGHFETITEDADFILRVIGADDAVSFPSSNHSSPTNSSEESTYTSYYKTLTDKELLKLYRVYEKDFEMFGYPPPDRLNKEGGTN